MATDDGMGDGDWSELEKMLFKEMDEAAARSEAALQPTPVGENAESNKP
jgi:hypothetical protein